MFEQAFIWPLVLFSISWNFLTISAFIWLCAYLHALVLQFSIFENRHNKMSLALNSWSKNVVISVHVDWYFFKLFFKLSLFLLCFHLGFSFQLLMSFEKKKLPFKVKYTYFYALPFFFFGKKSCFFHGQVQAVFYLFINPFKRTT